MLLRDPAGIVSTLIYIRHYRKLVGERRERAGGRAGGRACRRRSFGKFDFTRHGGALRGGIIRSDDIENILGDLSRAHRGEFTAR